MPKDHPAENDARGKRIKTERGGSRLGGGHLAPGGPAVTSKLLGRLGSKALDTRGKTVQEI